MNPLDVAGRIMAARLPRARGDEPMKMGAEFVRVEGAPRARG